MQNVDSKASLKGTVRDTDASHVNTVAHTMLLGIYKFPHCIFCCGQVVVLSLYTWSLSEYTTKHRKVVFLFVVL